METPVPEARLAAPSDTLKFSTSGKTTTSSDFMAQIEGRTAETGHRLTKEYAEELDSTDTLNIFRQEFEIPTKADLKRKKIARGKRQNFSQAS